jgi:hypothetical protein
MDSQFSLLSLQPEHISQVIKLLRGTNLFIPKAYRTPLPFLISYTFPPIYRLLGILRPVAKLSKL